MKNEEDSSLVLLEIIRGYSIFETDKKTVYFKHFTLGEMLELDEFERLELSKAKKAGIQTEEELIESAIKLGSWSTAQEEKRKSLEWMVNHSTKALTKMSDENQKAAFSSQIEGDRKRLEEVSAARRKICSYSAEHLSQQKRFFKMARFALYSDKKFKKLVKQEELDRLSSEVFAKFAELSNKTNLLNAIYFTYFFDVFPPQSRNPLALFGVKFIDLTIFQKNLLAYAHALLNKMKHIQIPQSIYGDPVKMFDYEEPKDNAGGAVSHGLDDLKKKMSQRGGELKPEDLLS